MKDAKPIGDLTVLCRIVAALSPPASASSSCNTVGRPLGQLRTLMNEGEKGNLTVRSSIRKKDEIGQVADSFNRMMAEITGLVRKRTGPRRKCSKRHFAHRSSRKTADAAKEIAVATEEIARRGDEPGRRIGEGQRFDRPDRRSGAIRHQFECRDGTIGQRSGGSVAPARNIWTHCSTRPVRRNA